MIKGHEQVEKSLEMKKCSRNGTAKIKNTRYRNVYNVKSHTSMLDGFYLTTQYQGECGQIEGHAYFAVPFLLFYLYLLDAQGL